MTNPCLVCGDTTDHKSDEALCGCLATMDGWTNIDVENGIGLRPGGSVDDKRHVLSIPTFLTDPSRGMEMLEGLAVMVEPFAISIHPPDKEELDGWWVSAEGSRGIVLHRVTWANTMQHAIARAYHTMKLAKWKEKS